MLTQAKRTAIKLFALVAAAVMALALCGSLAWAQTVSGGSGPATITVNNASKGETYSVYKLFDASVTGTEGGSIVYTGNIPESLSGFFTKNSSGEITATGAATGTDGAMSAELVAALEKWVGSSATSVASAEADGSTLEFTGLDYGYYIVTTSQGNQAITVTSTNPNAKIYDKNSTEPSVPESGLKSVSDIDVSIGDTVTYTIQFTASNYDGEGANAKQIASYTISDTLPEFLSDVTVTGITIGESSYTVGGATPQFDNNGQITISWVDNDGNSLYDNGVLVVVKYTAKINDSIAVGGTADANKNKVTVSWKTTDGGDGSKTLTGEETVATYAAAIQKVDENGDNLAGAKFSIKGLSVKGSKGNYAVVSYDPNATTGGTVMEADDDGLIVIKGIASDAVLVATEEEAPAGYNKLLGTTNVTPTKTSETLTITTRYYDENGKLVDEDSENITTVLVSGADKVTPAKVQNEKGLLLPSTGGMGTTIFYIVGGVLVAGAAVLLITRRRMNANK